MSAIVNTNLASLGAQDQLSKSRAIQAQAIQRLSSGLRINSASDDAAGLAISQRMGTQLRGLNVAARNAQDAISLSQTADGALGSIGDNLQRMRELAVQAANATNSSSDRAALQQEIVQLVQETDRIALQTSYNGQSLLNGTFSTQQFQVGANQGQTIDFSGIINARTSVLGQYTGAPTAPTTTAVAGLTINGNVTGPGQLIINGVDVYQGSAVGSDAHQLAQLIATANIPGLTASASNVQVGTWSATGSIYQNLVVDSHGFDVNLTGDEAGDIAATLARYAVYGPPNVVATDNGNGITLTSIDGSNIELGFNGFFGPIEPAAVGLGGLAFGVTSGYNPAENYGKLNLSYTGTAGLSITGTQAAALGLPTIPAIPATSSTALDQVDVSTVNGATAALATIDAALDTVNGQRSTLGALQHRFDAAIQNINSAAANTTAARSRITDADFAAETAHLATSNVLQQSASALVAQANALSNNVLLLLRN